jgi:mannose-1-phosphate guanylyltransferase
MDLPEHTWALILAAGEGSRLHSLTTTTDGVAVPKQFCSLYGGASLLQDALDRAAHVAPASRVCCIVATQHRLWWATQLSGLPSRNIIVQPENRGTANGILLPLMLIFARDPDAQVIILPADHYLRDETKFAKSLQSGAEFASTSRNSICLLGIEPEESDTELGYILPTKRSENGAAHVSKFVEKPTLAAAHALRRQGALWNAFILAAPVRQFIKLYDKRFEGVALEMAAVAQIDPSAPQFGRLISSLYQRLPRIDFSRDILEGQEPMLRVLTVPHCGWTDLGTPGRVARVLQHPSDGSRASSRSNSNCSVLNLSAQYMHPA